MNNLSVCQDWSDFNDGDFAARPETTGTVIRPVQAVTEDILAGQWDHGAVWTLSTAPSRNILTYLFTYLLDECVIDAHSGEAGASRSHSRSRWCHSEVTAVARSEARWLTCDLSSEAWRVVWDTNSHLTGGSAWREDHLSMRHRQCNEMILYNVRSKAGS